MQLRSPFAIDLYCWLSYRAGKLHENTAPPADISWGALMQQFGHGYKREVDFRKAFRKHLRTIIDVYPVRVESNIRGILVYPHPPHVGRKWSS